MIALKILILLNLIFASWWNIFSSKEEVEDKNKQESSSIILEDEDTPVGFEQPKIETDYENSRSWRKPDYSKSQGSLGYSDAAFFVPEELKEQVDFWKDIYTRYSSWQGVLHDSEHIGNIYIKVDFTEIMKNPDYNDAKKRKLKKDLVKEKKKEVVARLRRLQELDSNEGLSGEDLRYWKMYEKVKEDSKFIKASKKGRLRFQLGQSDYFLQGIYSSGRYIEKIEEIFQNNDLPLELTRLPFVESSFNLQARSKVGASGIWQFMPGTAKMYMKLNALVDYRNDPIASTKSAAKKLATNYKMIGSWPLAVTGYNYGPYGIARIAKKLNTKDLIEVMKKTTSNRFGFASRNFYASFLAALEVEKNADKFFKNPRWLPALDYIEYKLKRNLRSNTVKKIFEQYGQDFDLYNPQFTYRTRRRNGVIYRAYLIYLPQEKGEELSSALDKAAAPELKMAGKDTAIYEVRRGDTLSQIAEVFGVRMTDIIEANQMSSSRIYVGQTLEIPQ